jgi:DsbC/DsbD-like thiol-disulfide interchange protein
VESRPAQEAASLGTRICQAAGCLTLAVPLFLVLAFALLGSTAAPAQRLSSAHTKLELIAEQDSLAPGKPVWVALVFNLEKGWHVYWVNPGDSGEPPRVRWTLPAGFRAGAIRWPYPTRLGSASVVDYGYEDRVALLLPIYAPAALQPNSTATFGATVDWLVCREICVPDKAQVSLSLPVRNDMPGRSPAQQELFDGTRKKLPKPLPRSWRVRAESVKDHFVLSIETGRAEPDAVFFPLVPGQIENAAQQIAAPSTRGVRLTLQKSEQLLKPIQTLRGVLVLSPGSAFEIAAPVLQR